ncbi:MAG: hypothetical protein H6819_06165 [Phycisphaerales bacterium]|nr:hypothetical protein [Phycisphaerales bacterium]MCB9858595.1 hypothetical protein [Phycisphaerales bacterium]
MSCLQRWTGITVFLACSAQVASASLIVFSDGDFSPGDYQELIQTTGTASSTAETVSPGGNPGAFLKITNDLLPDSGVVNFQFNSQFVYDPSTQGEVVSAAGSFDAFSFVAGPGLPMVGVGLGARQGGEPCYTQSVNVSSDVQAWQIQMHPDLLNVFSCINWVDGGPIEFGAYVENGSMSQGYTKMGGIDNLHIELNTIPEPTSLALLIFAFPAFGLIVGRRFAGPALQTNGGRRG